MRVIAGSLGGRRLSAVPGRSTRPTAERVREALFSRLGSRYDLAGISVLDLFAGTGALGIEALSRGAAHLVAVDSSRRATAVLAANLEACGVAGEAEVLGEEVERCLSRLARAGRCFDGVFVDPPYGCGLDRDTLARLASGRLVSRSGWVAVESSVEQDMPESEASLTRVREDVYGDTKVTLYEHCGQAGEGKL